LSSWGRDLREKATGGDEDTIDRLLIAELRSAFIHNLSKDVQRRVGSEFAVDIHAGAAEVAATAQPKQSAIEKREEVSAA
jgi:hypothetical protein